MERTKKWFRLLIFMPLLLGVLSINTFVDPAGIFHDIAQSTTNELLVGNEVYFTTGNINERANKKCLIQCMPKHVECITVGPSLSMGITSKHVGTKSYYNFSASGLNYYDYLAIFGLLHYNRVSFDRAILCIDSYFFDENIIKREKKYAIWKEYAYYMEDLLNSASKTRQPSNNSEFNVFYTKITQMFSPSYFRASLSCLSKYYKELFLEKKRWGIVNDEKTASFAHYRSDGSWVYAQSFVNKPVDYVISHGNKYNIEHQFGKGLHASEYRKKMFIKLIDYLIANNVKIDFFLHPPAPVLWDRVTKEASQYVMFSEIEQFAHKVAKKYGIKVIGTYDPYKLNLSNKDYLDSRHIRHEKLAQYFDFSRITE